MSRIYFNCTPFDKGDVTLALESGVDGVIVPAEHVEQVRNYLACLNRDEDKEQTSARGLLVYLDQQRFRLVTLDGASELVSDSQEILPTEEGQS